MEFDVPAAVVVETAVNEFKHHQEQAQRDEARSHAIGIKVCGFLAAVGVFSFIIEHNVSMLVVVAGLVVVIAIGMHFEDRKRRADAWQRDLDEEEAAALAARKKAERDGPSAEHRALQLIAEHGADAPRIALERSEAAFSKQDFGHAVRWNSAARIAREQLGRDDRRA